MSDSPLFSPELEGLLREAAADPRSVLLRSPRPQSFRSLLDRTPPLQAAGQQQTLLDKHLLATYRDELVELLAGACLTKLFSNEGNLLFVHRSRRLNEDWEVPTRSEWSREAQARLSAAPSDLQQIAGFDLLIECCRASRFEQVSITQLARTSLRLRHTLNARAWVVLDQRLNDSYAHCIRLAEQLLSERTPASIESAVLEYRASALASMKEYEKAATDARTGFRGEEQKVSALVNWMHYAIMSGDTAQAREAGRTLDNAVRTPSPALLEQFAAYDQLWRRGFTPNQEFMRRTARALDQAVGPVSKKVLDVYL